MSRQPLLLKDRISGPHYQHNAQTLGFTRTSTSVLAGCVAGVLGLTGLYGFIFYLLSILLSAAVWMYRIDFDAKPYFTHWHHLASDGLMSGLMTYILFWTLMYDVVYIY